MIEAPASKSFSRGCSRGAASPREDASTQRGGYRALTWLNLLCLDAPLVAVSWHWLFARSFGVAIPPGTTAALFLTAWLIYLGDRFVDSLSLGADGPVSLRQRFCRQHRRAWVGAIALIGLTDVVVIVTKLDAIAITNGSLVAICAAVYLAVNQLKPSFWRVLPLKEVSIGFIFAAGAMVGLRRGLTSAALLPWLQFASLCALNCISIAIWERELDRAQGRTSIATVVPSIQQQQRALLLLLCVSSATWTLVLGSPRPLYSCLSLSALLLVVLDRLGSNIAPDVRTALADLVLLTPLLWLAT